MADEAATSTETFAPTEQTQEQEVEVNAEEKTNETDANTNAEAEHHEQIDGEVPPDPNDTPVHNQMESKDKRLSNSNPCRVCMILDQGCSHTACSRCRQRRVRCKHREELALSQIENEETRATVRASLKDFKPQKRASKGQPSKKKKKLGTSNNIGFAEHRSIVFSSNQAEEELATSLKLKDAIFQDLAGEDPDPLMTWVNAKLLKCGRTAEDGLMRCYFLGCPIEERHHYDISAAIYDMLELVGLYQGFSPSTINTKCYLLVMKKIIHAAFHDHYDPQGVAMNILRDICSNVTLHGKGGKTIVEIQEAGQYWRLAEVPIRCHMHPHRSKDGMTIASRPLSQTDIFREVKVLPPEKKVDLLAQIAQSLANAMGKDAAIEAFDGAIAPFRAKPKKRRIEEVSQPTEHEVTEISMMI